jgi:hypothetical protein
MKRRELLKLATAAVVAPSAFVRTVPFKEVKHVSPGELRQYLESIQKAFHTDLFKMMADIQ